LIQVNSVRYQTFFVDLSANDFDALARFKEAPTVCGADKVIAITSANIAYWHLADNSVAGPFFRYWSNSRQGRRFR
jgi:hypothetical protein